MTKVDDACPFFFGGWVIFTFSIGVTSTVLASCNSSCINFEVPLHRFRVVIPSPHISPNHDVSPISKNTSKWGCINCIKYRAMWTSCFRQTSRQVKLYIVKNPGKCPKQTKANSYQPPGSIRPRSQYLGLGERKIWLGCWKCNIFFTNS